MIKKTKAQLEGEIAEHIEAFGNVCQRADKLDAAAKKAEERAIEAEGAVKHLTEQLVLAREGQGRASAERDEAKRRRDIAEKDCVVARQEASGLKDELHSMTVELARLRGWRERVEAFDPVSEQQQYADQPRMPAPGLRPVHTSPDLESAMGWVSEHRPAPWYRRRA